MQKSTITRMISDFNYQFKQKNISIISAGTAFFFFLSIVPMLLLFFALIPYTPIAKEELLIRIQDDVPQWAVPLVREVLQDVFEKSLGIISFAAITAMFSSSQGVFAMYRGLNALHEVEEKRNYFVIRIRAAVVMIIMLLGVVLSLTAIMISRKVLLFLEGILPVLEQIVTFFLYFRFWIIVFVLGIAFAVIYTYLPAAKGLKLKRQLPGAFLASALWGIFSWGFSAYTSIVDYSLYGSLSVIVLTLLWMYFCMVLFFFGAFINIYAEGLRKQYGDTA